MITEHDSWRCTQEPEHAMYTQALVEHWFQTEAKPGTVKVVGTYPDGTVEVWRDGDDDERCTTKEFVVAYSGGPHVGNGDGTVEFEITYEPVKRQEKVDVYFAFEQGEPPTRPSVTIDMDGVMRYYGGDWRCHVIGQGRSTWSALRKLKTWLGL